MYIVNILYLCCLFNLKNCLPNKKTSAPEYTCVFFNVNITAIKVCNPSIAMLHHFILTKEPKGVSLL